LQRGTSTVTDIRLYSRENAQSLWQITLDRSPFQGGASRGKLTATAASGAVLVVEVEAVTHEAGEVWHLTRKPLPIGTEVTVEAFGEPPSGC
jgi:hypothetical protein